jgi:glutathionylspermidine synthase
MKSSDRISSIPTRRCSGFEPIWKMVASNKRHSGDSVGTVPRPSAAAGSSHRSTRPHDRIVKKPLYSREGANITVFDAAGRKFTTPGNYEGGAYVYQATANIPVFDGNYPIVGSWYVIDQGACAVGIRESDTPVTDNLSRFVPHLF